MIVRGSLLRPRMARNRLAAFSICAPVDVCASGISYHKHGILDRYSLYRVFNYATASQDIYYDYLMAREIITKRGGGSVKAWLVGLAYYSLHYDMTLSNVWENTLRYRDIFGYHNLSIKRRAALESQATNLPKAVFSDRVLGELCHAVQDITVYESKGANTRYKNSETATIQARTDFNKFYPKTARENRDVLEKYMQMLVDHKIKPLIVVAPVTDRYKSYVPDWIVEEFIDVVDGLQKRFDCDFIDGNELEGYGDGLFRDPTHLNRDGGARFTRHIDIRLTEAGVARESVCK